ncbi:MAG: NAD-dependent epimerase/dehydratase family protein [Ferruginibacter sp.]
MSKDIFITGGTGYIGSRLIKALTARGGYTIHVLVRKDSVHTLPAGCIAVVGDALDNSTYREMIPNGCLFVHLVGVAHPTPAKKEQFQHIDLASVEQAILATRKRTIGRFIYLSVAMYPTRIMQAFQQVRARGEALLLQESYPCSFLRPWYVLGPGHWWPILLKPVYLILRLLPSKKEMAQQLDTITIRQMIAALVLEIETPGNETRIREVKDMKANGS